MRSQRDMNLHVGNVGISHNVNSQMFTNAPGSQQDNLLHVGNRAVLQEAESQRESHNDVVSNN